MGYEFDCVGFDLKINNQDDFHEMIKELNAINKDDFFNEDIGINKKLYWYALRDSELENYYPNNSRPLLLKHGCCYKLHNLHDLFKTLAKYCEGKMEFKCEFGEFLTVELLNVYYYVCVMVYKEVPLSETKELFDKFNFPENEEGI